MEAAAEGGEGGSGGSGGGGGGADGDGGDSVPSSSVHTAANEAPVACDPNPRAPRRTLAKSPHPHAQRCQTSSRSRRRRRRARPSRRSTRDPNPRTTAAPLLQLTRIVPAQAAAEQPTELTKAERARANRDALVAQQKEKQLAKLAAQEDTQRLLDEEKAKEKEEKQERAEAKAKRFKDKEGAKAAPPVGCHT